MPVYNRDVERAYSLRFPSAKVAAQVATYRAANGGRWGGRRTAFAFILPDMAVNVASDSTIDLAQPADTYLVDQFKGATLKVPGVDAVGEFKVVGNTDTGVFTIEGVFSDAILDSVATLEPMTVVLDNTHELTGDLEALAIEIADSGEDVLTQFSLIAHRDGVAVTSWLDGGLASAGVGLLAQQGAGRPRQLRAAGRRPVQRGPERPAAAPRQLRRGRADRRDQLELAEHGGPADVAVAVRRDGRSVPRGDHLRGHRAAEHHHLHLHRGDDGRMWW